MKKWFFIILFFALHNLLAAQSSLKTIAPEKAVTVGEPFRLQFVAENMSSNQRFTAPDFGGLKIIRGPEKYDGSQVIDNRRVLLTNYIFTLVAERPGIYKISGAKVKPDAGEFTGEAITVIAEKGKTGLTAISDDYTGLQLLPGEDALKKIKENLFVKLFVDRKTCYAGEPVVATFKLFSRLQSRSDIVKNPGFYGFSVYDMINLEDKVKETEKINGKNFDVHTIRKVQLYPLQAGSFTIDEMKIENRVEFSRSVVNKKTEQKISEGVLAKEEETYSDGAEVYEMNLSTEPVTVKVNPLPAANKPAEFNGAAGNFTIRAAVSKKELDKNEEGYLEIIIEGKGNFTQITAPAIQWPKELEGFEPSVKDFLDKRQVPLSGGRIFRFPFLSSHTGVWKIPPVTFSFFNTVKKNYQLISTDTVLVNISNKEFKKTDSLNQVTTTKKVSIEEANRRASRTALILVSLVFVTVLLYWVLQGRKRKKNLSENEPVFVPPSVDEVFASLPLQDGDSRKNFYPVIYQASWQYLSQLYKLSGTEQNKNVLQRKMLQSGNETALTEELISLLSHFEAAMYTQIGSDENREDLTEKIKSVLKKLKY